MAGTTKKAAKAARTVSPSKGSPSKTKKKMTVKDREKKVSKTKDNSNRNLDSTENDMDIDTQPKENSLMKEKPKDLEGLYDLMESIEESEIHKGTLNQLRELALEWKDYHNDNTDILIMEKAELQTLISNWSNSIKDRMDVEITQIKRPNMLIDPSQAKTVSDLIDYSEQELIKFLHHNRAGTQISNMMELPNKGIEYLREQVIRSVQYNRDRDLKPTIKDTLAYLDISDYYEDQYRDLFVLQHHAKNWKIYKGESTDGVENEQLRDVLLDLLESARNEQQEKKPPPFEIDLDIKILEENFTPTSEEQRLEVISIIKEIIMIHAETKFKNYNLEDLKKLMKVWREVHYLPTDEMSKFSEEDLNEYVLEVYEQLMDELEHEEALGDNKENLRRITENLENMENINENEFEGITKEQLETFIFHKRIDHKDPVGKSDLTRLTRKDLIKQIIHILEMENNKPTLSATKYFLGNKDMTSNLEGIPIMEKKSHLKNWFKFIGSNTCSDEIDEDYLTTELNEAIAQWKIILTKNHLMKWSSK